MKKSFTAIWVEEKLIPSLRKQANMMEEVPLVRLSRRQQEILEDVAREQGGCIAFTYCGGYRLVQLNRDRHALWFARTDSEDRLRSTILHGTERRIRRNLEKARAGRQDAVEEIGEAMMWNDAEELERWTEYKADVEKEIKLYTAMLEAMGGE